MPVEIETADKASDFPVSPGTNQHEVLEFLTINDSYAYTPTELSDETEVNESSINKTLSRLKEKGLIERVESGYYHVSQERYDWIAENVELLQSYQLPGSHGYDEEEREISEEEQGDLTEETEETVEEILEEVSE